MNLKLLKIGGSLLSESIERILELIEKNKGNKIILTFGYSRKLRGILNREKYNLDFFKNRQGIEYYKIDNSILKFSLEASISQQMLLIQEINKLGLNVLGINGTNSNQIKGKKKTLRYLDNKECLRKLDDDYSGRITNINTKELLGLTNIYDVLLYSPIISSNEGILACDADYLALNLLKYLNLTELFILTDVNGVEINGKLIKHIEFNNMNYYINNTLGGMKKKLLMIKKVLDNHNYHIVICNLNNYLLNNNISTTIIEKIQSL